MPRPAKYKHNSMPILQTKNYKDFTIVKDTSSSEILVSFSDYRKANKCLHGDEVVWENEKCVLKKRAKYGQIVGTIEFTSKYMYGHTSNGNKIYLFHPLNPAFPPMRVGCSEKNTSVNRIALVEFVDWTESDHMIRTYLIRLLGPAGSMSSELEALRWRYGFPQLSKMKFDVDTINTYVANEHRQLIASKNTINIDPVGCKDVDDLVTIHQLNDTQYEVIITISDVAEYIKEDSIGDVLASQKGQTLYEDGVAVVPMFPVEMSEDSFSLLPGRERLGVSLYYVWDTVKKSLTMIQIAETRIVNNRSYSYESILNATDFPTNILKDVASHLKGIETNDSHEWIEELMLAYNKEVAKILVEAKGGLLRSHKPADKEKLERYTKIHPDLLGLAFEAAKYVPANGSKETPVHAALGSVPYAHATSPIRRYADLVNQRALKDVLRSKDIHPCDISLAQRLNARQKDAKEHNRYVFFLKQILDAPVGNKMAIVLEDTTVKTKVYVSSWKRMVSVKKQKDSTDTFLTGELLFVEYYSDMKKPHWKDRIVTRLRR